MDLPPASLIYQNSALEVFHLPGAKPFGAITFNEITRVANGRRFWADAPLARIGWHAIGIVSRSPNWFPGEAMRDVVAQRLVPAGIRWVAYGYSMGGHGALKWGAALGAEAALAYSPQHSIHPDELGFEDTRYRRFLDPVLNAGMAVLPDEPACALNVIVHDVGHALDRLNAQAIAAVRPATILTTRNLGHESVLAGRGSANLEAILTALLAGDVAAIPPVLRRGTKAALPHKVNLMRKLAARRRTRPFEALMARYADALERDPGFHKVVYDYRRMNGDYDAAGEALARALALSPNNAAYHAAQVMLLLKLGREADALALSHRNIARWPDTPPVRQAHEQALLRNGIAA